MMSRILYIPTEPKTYRQKRQHRRRRTRRGLLFFILIIALAVLFLYLIRLPATRIERVEVTGLKTLDRGDVESFARAYLNGSYALLIPRSSILFAKTDLLGEKLAAEFPQIGTITIEKKFLKGLRISIQERDFFGIFCPTSNNVGPETPPKCAFIDALGLAYEQAPRSSGSLLVKIYKDVPEVSLGTAVLDASLMKEMQSLKDELEQKTGLEITSYHLFSRVPREIRVQTTEGFELWFDRSKNIGESLKVLKTVLEQEIKDRRPQLSYVDLRFGNKVFYKFKK